MEPIVISEKSKVSSASFITGVYGWMMLALLVTALTSVLTVSSETLLRFIFETKFMFMGLIFAEIGVVWFLSARVAKLSNMASILLFLLYSVLNGLTLSVVLLAFASSTITNAFLVTSLTFGVMSVAGYFTKKDLSNFGSIMMMGLIGIIIASLVNYFMHSETLDYIISYVGVMIFVGLTAYDTQKIKNMANELEEDQLKKASIMGALTLYLDFVNLFLFLLRIFDRN
ncbi:MAG: Bax inhibitor-1/YccA family protein [Bacteroidia bacterium]|nr:Bax inhibitor-1/YccA family protein [Bacteroidia bacterium]MCF8427261.1 Bax inhibitor-1/YccA family protein [Bacteroidia bacterium]MCF8445979.1 Bax inhibitor-1/YccA family protein [Bacteroidia bacterium]